MPSPRHCALTRGHRGQNEHYATEEVFFDGVVDATARCAVGKDRVSRYWR